MRPFFKRAAHVFIILTIGKSTQLELADRPIRDVAPNTARVQPPARLDLRFPAPMTRPMIQDTAIAASIDTSHPPSLDFDWSLQQYAPVAADHRRYSRPILSFLGITPAGLDRPFATFCTPLTCITLAHCAFSHTQVPFAFSPDSILTYPTSGPPVFLFLNVRKGNFNYRF